MKKIILLLLVCISFNCGAQFFNPAALQTVTSGSTVTVTQGVGHLLINPASVLTTLTITFPASPNDRDILVIRFGGTISSGVSVVTALTLSSVAGLMGTLPTTAVSGMCMLWIYDASTGKWYRLI